MEVHLLEEIHIIIQPHKMGLLAQMVEMVVEDHQQVLEVKDFQADLAVVAEQVVQQDQQQLDLAQHIQIGL